MAENSYKVEYAPNSRAKCKEVSCKKAFEQDELRIAKITQNEDKKSCCYYHPDCFWIHMSRARKAKKVESKDDFEGFDKLKDEDQTKIEEQIQNQGEVKAPKRQPAKRKKKEKDEDDEEDEDSEKKKPKKKAQPKRKAASKKKKKDEEEEDDDDDEDN